VTNVTQQSACVADVEKRRGRQLTETVDRVLQQRKAGHTACSTTAPVTQHST
jgi:hypothetical protein